MSEQFESINDMASFLSQYDTQATEDSHEEQPEVEEVEVEEELEGESEEATEHDDDEVDDEDSTTDDDESEHDDEEDEDDDGSTEEFDITDKKFKVQIDGEEVTVNGKELKDGYMRQSAFSRKTQELAEKRKELDTVLSSTLEQGELVKFQADSDLAKLNGILEQAGGWENIRRHAAPEQFEQFYNDYVRVKEASDTAHEVLESARSTARAKGIKEVQSIIKEMSSTDSSFNKATISQMETYLVDNDFDLDTIAAMTNPKAWKMVYNAMRYEQLHSKSKTSKTSPKETNKTANVPSNKGGSTGKSFVENKKQKQKFDAQRKSTGGENIKISTNLMADFLSKK